VNASRLSFIEKKFVRARQLIASELLKFEFQQPKYALDIPYYFLKTIFLNHRVSIDDDAVMINNQFQLMMERNKKIYLSDVTNFIN